MKNEKVILIDDLEIYQRAMKIGEEVWMLVDSWNIWKKDTIGKQLVRAADSIAANISEGYGRYTYKDRRHFCYISRGSMFETRTWLQKARDRKIISEETQESFSIELNVLHQKLNSYIYALNKNIE
jgi:four helix bundle protein